MKFKKIIAGFLTLSFSFSAHAQSPSETNLSILLDEAMCVIHSTTEFTKMHQGYMLMVKGAVWSAGATYAIWKAGKLSQLPFEYPKEYTAMYVRSMADSEEALALLIKNANQVSARGQFFQNLFMGSHYRWSSDELLRTMEGIPEIKNWIADLRKVLPQISKVNTILYAQFKQNLKDGNQQILDQIWDDLMKKYPGYNQGLDLAKVLDLWLSEQEYLAPKLKSAITFTKGKETLSRIEREVERLNKLQIKSFEYEAMVERQMPKWKWGSIAAGALGIGALSLGIYMELEAEEDAEIISIDANEMLPPDIRADLAKNPELLKQIAAQASELSCKS